MAIARQLLSWPALLFAWAIGLGLVCLGGYWLWSTWTTLEQGKYVEGSVFELYDVNNPNVSTPPGSKKPSSSRSSYAPRIRYQIGGITYRITGRNSSYFAHYNVGDRVRVRYLEERPEDGHIDSFAENWSTVTLCFVVGSLILAAAAIATRYRNKVYRSTPPPPPQHGSLLA